MSGCGYKAAPYYEKDTLEGDDNVVFTIKDKPTQNEENNESCK